MRMWPLSPFLNRLVVHVAVAGSSGNGRAKGDQEPPRSVWTRTLTPPTNGFDPERKIIVRWTDGARASFPQASVGPRKPMPIELNEVAPFSYKPNRSIALAYRLCVVVLKMFDRKIRHYSWMRSIYVELYAYIHTHKRTRRARILCIR